MTHYVHTGTGRDRQRTGSPCTTTARTGPFYYVDTFTQRILTATLTARRYGYLPIRFVTVCGKRYNPFSADPPEKARHWWDVTSLPRCNGLDVISSDGIPTGIWFCSVTKPDLHAAMLMVKLGFIAAQTIVIGIVACWKGIDLVGTVWWFVVGKWVTRRRTWLSCKII